MKSNYKIGLKGKIKIISSNNEILLHDNNQIDNSALEIITRCLSQKDFSKSVDIIKLNGDFGSVEREITFVEYNVLENSMLFRAYFYETDFNGTANRAELNCSALQKSFSVKDNISITKDGQTRIQIDWKIFVTT